MPILNLSTRNLAGLASAAAGLTARRRDRVDAHRTVIDRAATEENLRETVGRVRRPICLGDVVAFTGMGGYRIGRVIKVGRTRVTARYYVPSTACTRDKVVAISDVIGHQA